MPTYNGNSVYIEIDTEDVSTLFSQVQLTSNIGTEDVTAGSGATHIERAEKLRDSSLTMQLAYEAGNVPTAILNMKPGLHTVVIGPEGNAAGKPKHEQAFILTSNQFGLGVDKPKVVFDISGEAAAAPVTDLFNGGVFEAP